jgi:hypothetical protein
MDATLILIDSDADLAHARSLANRLRESDEPADIARLQAQARLIWQETATGISLLPSTMAMADSD